MREITNHNPRDLIDGSALNTTERAQFDFIDWPAIDRGNESATFFRYRGDLYYLGNFMRTAMPGWDGLQADSAFSGIVVRFVDDGERIVVGTVLS